MNGQKIEACFATAHKLIFDDLRNRDKAPRVIALVFKDFDIQTYKVATYFKAVTAVHELVLVVDTYVEGLVRFSLINKLQQAVYSSDYYPCSREQYEHFLGGPNDPEKVIFTFYQENGSSKGLLTLEDGEPFFLYLPCYVQLRQFRNWKAV